MASDPTSKCAGLVRSRGGLLQLGVLSLVELVQFSHRLDDILAVLDVVPLEDLTRFMAADLHDDGLGNARAPQVADGGATQVVEEKTLVLPAVGDSTALWRLRRPLLWGPGLLGDLGPLVAGWAYHSMRQSCETLPQFALRLVKVDIVQSQCFPASSTTGLTSSCSR